MRKEYISISGKTVELSKLVEESSKAKSLSAKKLDESLRSLKRATEEFNRQKEYISILERRLRQLKLKKKTFEDLLNDNESNDWKLDNSVFINITIYLGEIEIS